MEHSPFASLPAELRNHIYGLALVSLEKVILDFEFLEKQNRLRIGRPRHLLALTETCRQIRRESLPLFYSNSEFVVLIGNLKWTAESNNVKSAHSKEPIRLFRDWLRTIGFESARAIRSVEVHAHVLPHKGAYRHVIYAITLLSSVVRFFVRTGESCSSNRIYHYGVTLTRYLLNAGAAVNFSLEGELVTVMEPGIFFMAFDTLPIDDPKAARLTLLNTWEEYMESWVQSRLDGTIDDWASTSTRTRGLPLLNSRTSFSKTWKSDWMMSRKYGIGSSKRRQD